MCITGKGGPGLWVSDVSESQEEATGEEIQRRLCLELISLQLNEVVAESPSWSPCFASKQLSETGKGIERDRLYPELIFLEPPAVHYSRCSAIFLLSPHKKYI